MPKMDIKAWLNNIKSKETTRKDEVTTSSLESKPVLSDILVHNPYQLVEVITNKQEAHGVMFRLSMIKTYKRKEIV